MSVPAINVTSGIHLLPDPVPPSVAMPAAVMPVAAFPPLKRISELECIPAEHCSYLLANRLLRRGETAGFVGASGLGKSTTVTQMGMLWAAGLPALGLAPLAPMRVVMMQAENDEAEMSMLTRGILRVAGLTEAQAALVEENFALVQFAVKGDLTAAFEHYAAAHTPDLIIVDPLLAYYKGNIADTSAMSDYMRPLQAKCHELDVAALFVHHTGKRQRTPGGAFIDVDPVYGAIGNSEFTNVVRVVLTLDRHREPGYARLSIGKRERRSPWVDADGCRVSQITLEPSCNPETPFWQRSAMEAMMVRPQPAVDRMATARAAVLRALGASGQVEQSALGNLVQSAGVSRDSFNEARKQLQAEGRIVPVPCPRPGTRPAIHWCLAPPAVPPRDDTAAVTTGNNPPSDGR